MINLSSSLPMPCVGRATVSAIVITLLATSVMAASPVTDDVIVVDLGGGEATSPLAINDLGQVVGFTGAKGSGDQHAFLWQGGEIRDLGTLGGRYSVAQGINNSGRIVGWSRTDEAHGRTAFIWESGEMRTFDKSTEQLMAINDSGLSVGAVYSDIPVIWHDGVKEQLRGPNFEWRGFAVGVNASGQVIADFPGSHGIVWQSGTTKELGSLGKSRLDWTRPFAINSLGQVVGTSKTSNLVEKALLGLDPVDHAFLWRNGEMVDIGTLGGEQSAATGINDAGVVVGWSQLADQTYHAFVWQAGTLFDLNDLLPANSGWVLEKAVAINSHNQAIGTGLHNGKKAAFLLKLPGSLASRDSAGPGGSPPDPRTQAPDQGVPAVVLSTEANSVLAVTISTDRATRYFACSAAIIEESGLAVTDRKCIRNAKRISVALRDGTSYQAHEIASDRPSGVALIKLDSARKFRAISFSDYSQLNLGDRLFASSEFYSVGWRDAASVVIPRRPGGLQGVLPAEQKSANPQAVPQITRDIWRALGRGVTGGPILDSHGAIVAVSLTTGGRGEATVLTANYIRPIVAKLRASSPNSAGIEDTRDEDDQDASSTVAEAQAYAHDHPGWLGIQTIATEDAVESGSEFSGHEGVVVQKVAIGSPAWEIGLRGGEFISRAENETFFHGPDLRRNAPEPLTLTFWHHGNLFRADLIASDKSATAPESDGSVEIGAAAGYGLRVAAVSPALREHFKLRPVCCNPYLVVTDVNPAGILGKQIQPGDQIMVSYNNGQMKSPDELKEMVERVLVGESPGFMLTAYHSVGYSIQMVNPVRVRSTLR